MKRIFILLIPALMLACNQDKAPEAAIRKEIRSPYLIILGTVQDGGSPHIGCEKDCCRDLFAHPDPDRMVVSLGLVDPRSGKRWIFEASPDFARQLRLLRDQLPRANDDIPDGIFLTHAHIGHYTGLMYLGREALGAEGVAVYAMPRMEQFLQTNGPWSQLHTLNNISLHKMKAGQEVELAPDLHVRPIRVPHRDEFSETVGFVIEGPNKKALFIPDIDKWGRWEQSITEQVGEVDYALLDATFFDAEEVGYRDLLEIPHPFVVESMGLFGELPASEKSKIHFIHFNHSNPLLDPQSEQAARVVEAGFHIALPFQLLPL